MQCTKKIIFTVIFLLGGILYAQKDSEIGSFFRSEGEIPADIKTLMTCKPGDDQYNSFLRSMIMQGNLIYGTSLNRYIDAIADVLLKDDPSLRKKMRFYILRSSVVNATATENGIVIINLGLMAQVSNEADLAFIMAHEISHYVEHHAVLLHEYRDNLDSKKPKDFYLNYHNRSRENETLADKSAIERFYKQSPYSFAILDGTFDVLQYSDLPFDEIPFTRAAVETEFYQFPKNYFLENLTPIHQRADAIDTLSTHPNIDKRRERIHALIRDFDNTGRKEFVNSESAFKDMKRAARFECLNIFLTQHNYADAAYNSFVMLKEMPDNEFVRECYVAAMYGFAKHKNYAGTNDVVDNYRDIEGEKQQVNYFLSKLNRVEAPLLALRFAWIAHRQFPSNSFFTAVSKDLMQDIIKKNKLGDTDFSDYPMGIEIGSIPDEVVENDTMKGTNKYEKIKGQTKTAKVKPTSKFKTANYMLVDLRQDPEFMKVMNEVKNKCEDQVIQNLIADRPTFAGNKMIIATPYYETDKGTKNGSMEKQQSKNERTANRFSSNIAQSIKKLKIEAVVFSEKSIAEYSTQQYNDYAKLQQWITDYTSSAGVSMIYYQSRGMEEIAQHLSCQYINHVTVHKSNAFFMGGPKFAQLALTVLCPYIAPVTLSAMLLPRYYTNANFSVVNFATGETLQNSSLTASSVMSEACVNSFVFDCFYCMKKGEKKK